METLKKQTGPLDINKYILVKKVASMVDVHPVTVYKAIRLGRLRSVKVAYPKKHPRSSGFITVTTQEWIDEWRATLHDKSIQKFNGRQMYDKSKGELSTGMARKLLGYSKNKFDYYIQKGHIKFIKKGFYYVLDISDVLAFKAKMEQQQEEIAQ